MIFNGAIYNFHDLKSQLEPRGYTFRSTSDTEVALAAIEHWGFEAALRRFVGMFAIAVWDTVDRRLRLARDRAGQKPLYYGKVGNVFAFASELGGFIAIPGFARKIDPHAAALFARYAYVPAPHSIFRGIQKLGAGEILEISADTSSTPSIRKYWRRTDFAATATIDAETAQRETANLISTAVKSQMIADVPLGAFLSGGFDSTAVVAMMQRHANKPVQTFTVGFTESAFDESVFARGVAKHLGTDHTEVHCTAADALAVIERLPAIYDEPFADPSQIPTVLVSRLARRSVTVALSGDGGDELFGGYNRHRAGPALWSGIRRTPLPLRHLAARGLERVLPLMWPLLGGRPGHADKIVRTLPARSLGDLYDRLIACRSSDESDAAYELPPGRDPADAFMTQDFLGYLPDDILVKVDRATMSVGLEARAPLLDHRLVEFVAGIPSPIKLAGKTSKRILRDMVYAIVPRSLMNRPKAGFDIPIADWLRGPLRTWADDLLAPQALMGLGDTNANEITAAWNSHRQGRQDRAHEVWAALMFQSWARHYGASV